MPPGHRELLPAAAEYEQRDLFSACRYNQSSAMGSNPKVFISYSHDSVEHRERVLALPSQIRQLL